MDSNVVKFHGHKRERACNCGACFQCCLFICSTCGGAEASLPTHCPQDRMTTTDRDLVEAGMLDFQHGRWCPGEHPNTLDNVFKTKRASWWQNVAVASQMLPTT